MTLAWRHGRLKGLFRFAPAASTPSPHGRQRWIQCRYESHWGVESLGPLVKRPDCQTASSRRWTRGCNAVREWQRQPPAVSAQLRQNPRCDTARTVSALCKTVDNRLACALLRVSAPERPDYVSQGGSTVASVRHGLKSALIHLSNPGYCAGLANHARLRLRLNPVRVYYTNGCLIHMMLLYHMDKGGAYKTAGSSTGAYTPEKAAHEGESQGHTCRKLGRSGRHSLHSARVRRALALPRG
ncbi:hypothetical protein B0T25DRAFT_315906 [Lasiosphaeria hispida]|uniref:Uncharacterized protein n=1 Tax=Lasiosphaeria hispida TaxID=260671 RepID=A0AAJ0H926_9PEZI|nr:hypothetical protein B0T25DRAFT_315906 [Lasiosphaeria hispida]